MKLENAIMVKQSAADLPQIQQLMIRGNSMFLLCCKVQHVCFPRAVTRAIVRLEAKRKMDVVNFS